MFFCEFYIEAGSKSPGSSTWKVLWLPFDWTIGGLVAYFIDSLINSLNYSLLYFLTSFDYELVPKYWILGDACTD